MTVHVTDAVRQPYAETGGSTKMKHTFKCDGSTAVVRTEKGLVRGYEYDGLTIFKGIPYAKARRFHRPEPCEAWDGSLDCTSYGFVCPLLATERPNGELYVPHRYWIMDEDCQNLNIWTKGCDDKKRPVMVWLHGGGFEAGSAIEHEAYDGAAMADLGDVVVVSINHRLNVLGYFDLSDFGPEYENSGNAGGDDIIAALKWIHKNIAAFGGDPGNVTVFGQSGGGMKVTTLLQSPEADGLYHKGIIMSGVVGSLLPDQTGSGREFAEAILQELGLHEVHELETVKSDRLADAYNKLKPIFAEQGKYIGSAPHPNRFYAGEPDANAFRKETKDIPLLIGSVYGEFMGFMPQLNKRTKEGEAATRTALAGMLGVEKAGHVEELYAKAYPERSFADIFNMDFVFRAPQIPYVQKRTAINDHTYVYLFNENTALDEKCPWHCYDVPFFFHNTEMVPSTAKESTEQIEDAIFSAVMAFARTGSPATDKLPGWSACQPGQEHTMLFQKNPEVVTNHDHELMSIMAPAMSQMMMQFKKEDAEKVQH